MDLVELIKTPTLLDVEDVLLLNKKWLKIGLLSGEKPTGFLFGDELLKEDLIKIIENKEIVICSVNKKIVGYYLLDNYSKTSIRKEHENIIFDCKKNGLILNDLTVSNRMQCVVDDEYQMRGLSRLMFNELQKRVNGKYDLFFATASKNNPKYKAHLALGWEVIGESDELFYVAYKIY